MQTLEGKSFKNKEKGERSRVTKCGMPFRVVFLVDVRSEIPTVRDGMPMFLVDVPTLILVLDYYTEA